MASYTVQADEHLSQCPEADPALRARAASRVRQRAKADATKRERSADRRETASGKKRQRRERMGEIHRQVWERANGQCEAWVEEEGGKWVRCKNVGAHVDHWFGGYGRRRPRESRDTCWLLCGPHDLRRTNNDPSAAHWNVVFGLHCEAREITFTPHIVNEPDSAPSRRRDGGTRP